MKRIKVENPIVELDGDEMARVVWGWIKETLVLPYLDVNLLYYDLGLPHRDATDDRVTIEAAEAIKVHHVGVKCAAINPDQARVKEYGLKKAWRSPNARVRNIVGGTLFREPVVCRNVPRRVAGWAKPIVVARHAFADEFAATDFLVPGPGTVTIRFQPKYGGETIEHTVLDFPSSGIALGMYNLDDSMEGFARASMTYGLDIGYPVYLGTKNTALKAYDNRFKEIFQRIYESEFKARFEAKGIFYEHRLVDELAAFAIKSSGGFVYACRNRDGDIQSDMVAEGFGSLGLMASILMTPDGRTVQTEAAHGTITRHYRLHQQGKETSTNPVASIIAWARALDFRGRFDGTQEVRTFAQALEAACVQTIESGVMTKDLAILVGPGQPWMTTKQFLNAVDQTLREKL
ncbi:MAG: NADP-dependent isocitrate dehydrogenase [Rhodospirillales bacterium]|nr:NADP-dependent isocitrate dehydrogenase [Rhodospirillales bacterium]